MVIEESKHCYDKITSELGEREMEIRILQQKDFSNSDAIAALADRLEELCDEIEFLKKANCRLSHV